MTRTDDRAVLHGSVVAHAGRGALILGRSGAGKSGLALRLIALGAELVADDRVRLACRGDALIATAPASIAGLIEARGFGLIRVPVAAEARVVLAVDLDRPAAARLPQPDTFTHAGMRVRLISGRDLPNLDAIVTILLQDGRDPPD